MDCGPRRRHGDARATLTAMFVSVRTIGFISAHGHRRAAGKQRQEASSGSLTWQQYLRPAGALRGPRLGPAGLFLAMPWPKAIIESLLDFMFKGITRAQFRCAAPVLTTRLIALTVTRYLHRGQVHRSVELRRALAHRFRTWRNRVIRGVYDINLRKLAVHRIHA